MNPEFGTKLHTYIFNPIDDIVEFEATVLNEISRAVQVYETRVTVDKTQSIARFSPDSNELQVLLSLIVPPGINREIGLTLSSVVKVDL
jgi:phage baseplate assembly protein W